MAGNLKDPLLYIQQPNISFPQANMQEVFTTRGTKKTEPASQDVPAEDNLLQEQAVEEEKGAGKEETSHLITESKTAQEVLDNYEIKQDSGQSTFAFSATRRASFNRVKSFKEMNLQERINYLYNFPQQLPPVPCIFESAEESIRGFLVGRTAEEIEVRKMDGTIIKMTIASLNSVKMIGLRS